MEEFSTKLNIYNINICHNIYSHYKLIVAFHLEKKKRQFYKFGSLIFTLNLRLNLLMILEKKLLDLV